MAKTFCPFSSTLLKWSQGLTTNVTLVVRLRRTWTLQIQLVVFVEFLYGLQGTWNTIALHACHPFYHGSAQIWRIWILTSCKGCSPLWHELFLYYQGLQHAQLSHSDQSSWWLWKRTCRSILSNSVPDQIQTLSSLCKICMFDLDSLYDDWDACSCLSLVSAQTLEGTMS